MKWVVAGVAWLLAWAVVAPPAWAEEGVAADLAVTLQWGSPGTPHVRTGDVATWTLTVTNTGPDTAQQVVVGAGGSDQFRRFTSSCGEGSWCELGDLAAGDSRAVVFSAQGCLFQTEHRRVWWVSGSAESLTADPDPADNYVAVDVRITGPVGTCPS